MTSSRRLSLLAVAALLPVVLASGPAPEPQEAPPRLVVLVVVDQLRADLLDRFDDAFDEGLRRLRVEGLQYVNATHDHGQTETSPGHASIATGTYPSKHGVVRNAWWEQGVGGWEQILNVVDEDFPLVGYPDFAGASPAKLLRTGLADWLLEAHPDARVASFSAKDRAAVLLGGRSRAPVYWIEPSAGLFMTSVYYRDEDPDWITRFNREEMPDLVRGDEWSQEVPGPLRALSRADTVDFEADRVHTHFPHRFLTPDEREELEEYRDLIQLGEVPEDLQEPHGEAGPGSSLPEWWDGYTPGPDAAVAALARVAVEELEMGEDEVPDLLALSFSQTDRIGHKYGPLSREQLDNLVHLDRVLGELFEYLDDRVGADAYTVVLTADHGVQTMPEQLAADGHPGRRLTRSDLAGLEAGLNQVVGERASEGPAGIADGLRKVAEEQEWIAMAWDRQSLLTGEPADSFAALQANSLHPQRPAGLLSRFGVEYQYPEGILDWAWPDGTHHGSIWHYDRHVPLVFMGAGIAPGVVADRAATVDIAPTLARLMGIAAPEDLDGAPLFGN